MKQNKKYLKWALLGVIAISFAINYSSIFDPKPDQNGDNFCYYFLGKNLSEGNGYILGYEPVPTPHLHFPPGYPFFLSVMMKIFPDNTSAMKVINGLLFLLSLFLLFRIIRKTAPRYGLLLAFLTCFLCTLHPTLLRWSTIMMSEMLYLAISLGIIAVCVDLDLEKLQKKEKKQLALLILLCILVFSTYFIRTMGVSVILAVVFSFAILAVKSFIKDAKDLKKWSTPLVVSTLIVLSLFAAKWSWDARNNKIAPSYSSTYSRNFMSKGGDSGVMETFDDWKKRIGTNLTSFVTYYIPQAIFKPAEAADMFYYDIKPNAFTWILGIFIITLMITGIICMSSARWIILLYLFITYGVLLLYQEQFAGLRYTVPVIPLLIFGILSGVVFVLDLIAGRFLKKNKETYVSLIVIILSMVLSNVLVKNQENIKQMAAVKSDMRYSDSHPYKQYIRASMYFTKAPSNYLVACRKPELFHYYSKYHHCINIPKSGTPEDVIKFLTNNKVDAVIIDCWFPHAYRVVLPAVIAYPEHFSVMEQFGDNNQPTYVLAFIP